MVTVLVLVTMRVVVKLAVLATSGVVMVVVEKVLTRLYRVTVVVAVSINLTVVVWMVLEMLRTVLVKTVVRVTSRVV